jgi:hypothetical protein
MSKTALVLATVATLGLCGTAFAEGTAPAMKDQVRPAAHASVVHKKRTGHYAMVHGHKVWMSYHPHGKSKKYHVASHVTGNKKKPTKSAS